MHQYFVDKAAPGNDWALSGTHTIKMDYLTNVADEVKYYSVAANEATMVSNGYYDIALTENGFYNSNQLFKSVVKNENWTSGVNNTTEEFKDKLGRVVLKRNYESSVKHDTYYVYDQFGNLTYVIPPLVNTLDTVDLTILDGLCYQYRYDVRNRLVEKKLPGKDWEFIVYDKLNRIVATGPAYSPFIEIANNKGWLISKYDIFNRSVLTAWVDVGGILDSATRKTLQQEHDGRTVFSEGKSTADVNVNNIRFRYTNLAHPTTGYNVLTVNYYDDYNYTNAPTGFTTTIEGEPIFYNNSTAKPKGMPTGSWVRVLESLSSTNRNLTYSLYDKYARPIHTRTNTYLTGYNRVDTKFSFSGRTDYTVTRHKRISADVEMVIRDVYTYSEQDRIVTHLHRINNAPYQLMARNEYTELGQLIGKKTGGTSTTAATFYQNTSYKYNVRGWLTGINDTANLTQGSDPVDLFAFKINYNTIQQLLQGFVPGIEPLYNGNISETYWRTASDNVLRKYSYKYDKMNRLRSAHYQKPNNSVIVTDSYNESMTYDKNGNIMTLHRNGEYDDSFTALEIDDLDYAYNPEKPNELKKVTDGTNNPNGFNDDSDGTNDSADDYEYDGNGNLTSDQNKQIISISYNHLNLPVRIRFAAGSIDYLYDATGTKLRKTVTEQQNVTVTEYLGGFQYLNAKLDFFGTAQGFVKNLIRNEVNNYFYIFTFTDHLGNVRLSYGIDPDTGQLGILEENNYYAYGLKHKNYNLTTKEYKAGEDGISLENCNTCPGIKYKYNGQEWQDELGLNMYDMDFRDYDPAIGRWTGIDPITHHSMSPYMAFDGNPVYWADPSGADSVGGASFSGSAAIDAYNAIIGAMDSFGDSPWSIAGVEIYNSSNSEISESGPGASFSSALNAAIDFGRLYNGYSILNHTEVGTIIYSFMKNKLKTFSYAIPIIGTGGFVLVDQISKVLAEIKKNGGATIEALAHTHGSEDSDLVKQGLVNSQSLVFSGDYYNRKAHGDIAIMKNWHGNPFGRPIDGYLAAPDGGLYYFSPNINYTNTLVIINGENFFQYQKPVYTGLPSDSGLTNNIRNERLNIVDPVVIPNLQIRY